MNAATYLIKSALAKSANWAPISQSEPPRNTLDLLGGKPSAVPMPAPGSGFGGIMSSLGQHLKNRVMATPAGQAIQKQM